VYDPELFDAEALDTALAATTRPLTAYRQTLRNAAAVLEKRFAQGTPVAQLVRDRARVVDEVLQRTWRGFLGDFSEDAALCAVGGYGRGELHPHSDIDILVLLGDGDPTPLRPALEALLALLWDIGLEVGHSVRSITDCVQAAESDITIATNLMESRLITGDSGLFDTMRRATGPERLWPSRAFFAAKWEEQRARHRKFDDTSYNLEPNLKEGPGGLRDIQMIGWVAKRHFGAETLSDLVAKGFLTATEYRTLYEGQNFLWKVRFGLHTLAGRREDRLLFEYQRTLASRFGYRDTDARLAVEQFMKAYYRWVMELNQLNEMLLQLYQEEILYGEETATPERLNRRFQIRRGFLEIRHERIFEHYPFALLELFLLLAQQAGLKGVRAGTIRAVRASLHLIDDDFRHDLRCRSLFMELLRQPAGVTHELRRMNRYGVLAAYLPPFGRITGQMQHDLFHVYTVDEHTLFVVRNLRRLALERHREEFPLCSTLMQNLPKPELTYIAALFHDIAKGRGGDHSELGAEEAEAFCRHHELSCYDTRLVVWLVRHHLLMSSTAQRQDISDPEVINEFARHMGERTRLDYLYLLTVADIRATSPTVWNAWKDALLAELYYATRHALRRGLSTPLQQQEVIAERQREAYDILREAHLTPEAVAAFWDRVDEDYFLRYSADEIAWHTRAIALHPNVGAPMVLIRQHTERGGTEIFIYSPIGTHQFTTNTAVLDHLGLNIVDARIIPSRDDYTLDTYIVLDQSGEPIRNAYRIQQIENTLHRSLLHPEAIPRRNLQPMTRRLRQFTLPTQVELSNDPHNPRTILEVITSDRPGLLSRVAKVLAHCKVRLQNAKIATFGARVEDIFFITDSNGNPIDSPATIGCLKREIRKQLDEPEGTT